MVSLKSLLLGVTSLTTPVLSAPAAAASPQEGGSVIISPQDPEGGGSVIIFPLPGTRPSAPFGGVGQIRTRSREGPDYADLGCLTKEGRWTVNESQCGVFKADRSRPEGYGIDIWTLKSKAGPCQTWFARFKCEKGADSTEFGPWVGLPGGIPGVEVLRWGQYGLMAGYLRNPPLKTDEPQEIHFVSYTEPGKYVWLTWSPLKDKAW
ncbi:hypothetical protein V8F20_010111 [Naviculisporaceae sp. PSN 640]